VIRSDEVRKELAGVRPGAHPVAPVGEGIYGPEITAATYAELLRRASIALRLGESVILDASWMSPGERLAATSAAVASYAQLHQIRCVAPAATAAARLRERLAVGDDPSDATPEIAAALAAGAAPWPEASEIATTAATADVLSRALTVLDW
jgi:predicted kinase